MGWIDTLLGRKPKTAPEEKLRLVESVAGNWFYHLAKGRENKPLCGRIASVMYSPAPLDTWGYRGDQNERYCEACERLAIEQNLGLPESVHNTANH